MDYAHTPKPMPSDLTDDDTQFLHDLRDTFAHAVFHGTPVFQTQPPPLWQTFIAALPAALRQVYTCHACRYFVERYGHLVTIDPVTGAHTSALWQHGPETFLPAIHALRTLVEKAPVVDVFLSTETTWGTPQTGPWSHFAVSPPRAMLHRRRTLTAAQAIAEKHEDYGMLQRSLAEFPFPLVQQAQTILAGEQLSRGEKHRGVATWLLDLHTKRAAVKHRQYRDNLVWYAVATAPPGFCHIRTTMIGTLLDDLASGMGFDTVQRRFADKMHPLRYQRPTAAPTEGNIAQAEKQIADLGLTASLQRRFAWLDDIQEWVWQPPPPQEVLPPPGQVFAHLRPKHPGTVVPQLTAETPITWEKFFRTVLPQAQRMAYYVPPQPCNYITLVTAVDAAAPPLLQWDDNERRNPVSWYVYNGGARPDDFGLRGGSWHPVVGIIRLPARWHKGANAHQGDGMILVLDGAHDQRYAGEGGLFFPETLRQELHSVRATLEAYARQGTIVGKDGSMVCGVDLRQGMTWDALVRVETDVLTQTYRLERWD